MMNSLKLSKRLQAVADYVETGSRLADIGSDHAYLPCHLAETNRIPFAVAGEVVRGPYENAQKEVRQRGLEDKVIVRLGDGLAVVTSEDNIDTITIAGMGGALIRSILEDGLENGQINGSETLILQPNVYEVTVRDYLMTHHYRVTDETMIKENGKLYEIIKAVPSKEAMNYSKQELLFGPKLLCEKSAVFKEKWTSVLNNTQRIINQMEKAQSTDKEKLTELREYSDYIKEVLS